VDYDPAWPVMFEQLRARLWPAVEQCAIGVEHVGSTSVPGLAAKPIVDMTVIVAAESDIPIAIARLATVGYVHQGNLGIEGRKRRLAARFQHDIDGYVGGKTDAILRILRDSGFPPDKLEAIADANRKSE
jgi:GrpB-like predicted nucleotidyltransferase (UPF0157 family)